MNEDAERARMEAFYRRLDVSVGWGRDKQGTYHALYARNAWAAWQEAMRPRVTTEAHFGDSDGQTKA